YRDRLTEVRDSGPWRGGPPERSDPADPPAGVVSAFRRIEALVDARLTESLTRLGAAFSEQFAEHEREHHSAPIDGGEEVASRLSEAVKRVADKSSHGSKRKTEGPASA